jgi:Protein of unknown function (DUF1416)
MTAVEGTVKVEGIPSRSATVELLNSTGDIVTQSTVDDHGHFRFHLAAGAWSLNAYDTRGNRARASFSLSEGEDRALDIDLQGGG